MDAKEYITLCQRVALLPDGVMNTKNNVPDSLKVVYNGAVYYPIARIAAFEKETVTDADGNTKTKPKLIISARLHDINANCVIECLLDKVEKYRRPKE